MNNLNNSEIKLVLFDLEGVLLNGENQTGLAAKIVEFSDQLDKYDKQFAILTGSDETELIKELKKHQIIVITSSFDKVNDAQKLLNELSLEFENVLYIGDDILDIPLLQRVNMSVAPKNARREVKRVAVHHIDNRNLDSMFAKIISLI